MMLMMWFDDNPKSTFEAKVQRAAEYYLNKFGVAANICVVNHDRQDTTDTVGQVAIKKSQYILPNHFWIGFGDTSEK